MKRMLSRASVRKIGAISPVWIVPAVALLIALWLAVRAHMEQGVFVEITFDSAADMIAGQTQVKLNDVKVGVVKRVKLSNDLRKVIVTAELDRDIANHLSSNTRFWVVTPRISATGVSNLGTLISGVYIVMDPGAAGGYKTVYEGLHEPPAFQSDEKGLQYILQAEELGSLDIGSPLYYRQIRVGEVTSYKLSENREHVDVHIFIRSPYDQLVQTRSRFWNVSGFGVSINADGMKARMESLASLVNGGIAFDNAAGFENVEIAKSSHRFYLYNDRESVLEGRFNIKYYYLLKFAGSVRGLTVGAPVEFRGIKVGEVVDVVLAGSSNSGKNLHVFISMEPQRLEPSDQPTRIEVDDRIAGMVEQGLRAKMKTASLITGSRFIDLSFIEDSQPARLIREENYSEIPTVADDIDQIGNKLSDVLDRVAAVPFDKIGNELAGSLANLNRILATLEKQNTAEKLDGAVENLEETLATANDALKEMKHAMSSLEQAVAPDSELKYELTEMAKSLGDAGKSLELFLNELNRKPNALISGKEKDK